MNEFEQPIILGMQAGADMLHRRRAVRQLFRARSFAGRSSSMSTSFAKGWRRRLANTRISNVWQEFERGTFAMYVTGPVERQRVSPPDVACDGRQVDDGSAGRAPTGNGPGVSIAGGCSLVVFRRVRARRRPRGSSSSSCRSDEQQVELCRCTSNLPARDEAWEAAGLLDDPEYAAFHEQLQKRAARAARAGVGGDRHRRVGENGRGRDRRSA